MSKSIEDLRKTLESMIAEPPVDTGIFCEPSAAAKGARSGKILLDDMLLIEKMKDEGASTKDMFQAVIGPSRERRIDQIKRHATRVHERYANTSKEEALDQLADSPEFRKLGTLLTRHHPDFFVDEDAPPVAVDAEHCLTLIAEVEAALQDEDLDAAVDRSIELGGIYGKMLIRGKEPAAREHKRLVASRRKGGTGTAKASKDELRRVVRARDALIDKNRLSKVTASEMIADQLYTGTFPGIPRRIKYSPKYISRLDAEG